jgi:cytochrome oxidase assembly protein ShyY1
MHFDLHDHLQFAVTWYALQQSGFIITSPFWVILM